MNTSNIKKEWYFYKICRWTKTRFIWREESQA